MKHSIATRFALLSALAVSAITACSSAPMEDTEKTAGALGTCPPGEQGVGNVCGPCPTLNTPAIVQSSGLNTVFNSFIDISLANYTVLNDTGTLNIGATKLAQYGFTAPAPAKLSIPSTTGTYLLFDYTATTHVPSLTLSWNGTQTATANDGWTAGANGVTIAAHLSATFDINLVYGPFTVTPTLTVTGLPVSITFGADGSGNATVPLSQVVVAPLGAYSTFNGCGAFGWCTNLLANPIDSAFQTALQSTFATQFYSALNGVTTYTGINGVTGTMSSPFWVTLMNSLANQPFPFSLVLDPEHNPLPNDGHAVAGGTVSKWGCTAPPAADPTAGTAWTYANNELTGTCGTTGGLCYLDCTPKTVAQQCGAGSCGTIDDGCGDTLTCPGTCSTGDICTNNKCVTCVPLTCASVGEKCGAFADGCGGTISCNTCGVGLTCESGACVGTGGTGGTFCSNCVKTGGICSVGAGGKDTCIHE